MHAISEDGTGVLLDDKAIYEARGHHIVIKVGSAPSGSGTFALTTTGLPKGAADYKNDDAAPLDVQEPGPDGISRLHSRREILRAGSERV